MRFKVHGSLRDVLLCHCSECRRWSGYAFAATAAARGELELVEERGLRWVDSPASDTHARRGFCAECGSSLFWDAPGRDYVAVSAGTIDPPTGLRVVGHVYTSQVADFYELPDDGLPRRERLS